MTLDEQIEELIRSDSGKITRLARVGTVVVMAGVVLTGAFSGNPVFYGIALIFALPAFAIWRFSPNISSAARGLKEGLKQDGAVEIYIDHWTDAEANRYESYRGLVLMDNQPLWHMEFVTPQSWQPAEGPHFAQLVFIRGVEWPVVILTREGLLYPRWKPRRASVAAK